MATQEAPDTQRTEDGRYIVVDGRCWRATDPAVPDHLRAELVAELMAARRAVRDGKNEDSRHAARGRVQDAKVSLGERGEPWWDAPSDAGLRIRLRAAVLALLRHREPDRTICPSDAARAVGGAGWRRVVPVARDVAAKLHAEGVVEVRQKGERVDPSTAKGPLRIGRGHDFA